MLLTTTQRCVQRSRASAQTRSYLKRDLFNFPPFSPFSLSEGPGQHDLQTYRERKIMPYSRKKLYDIVADVTSYPHFIPYCTRSRILSPPSPLHDRSEGTQMEAELTVSFLAFKESYVSTVTCRPYERVEAVASSQTPLFRSLSTTWRFAPAPSQGDSSSNSDPRSPTNSERTLVALDLAYSFANPIHAAAASAFFGQVSRAMVKAFETRCRSIYGSDC